MRRGRSLLVAGAGAALAWFLDPRQGAERRARALEVVTRVANQARGAFKGGNGRGAQAALIAPPTAMSGPIGAGRPGIGAESGTADNTSTVRPTPATAGPLPLTDETAGGHHILGGGPRADTAIPGD